MKSSFKGIKFFCSLLIIIGFILISFRYFEAKLIWNGIKAIIGSPFTFFIILSVYFLSFCLKAAAWRMYLNGRPRFSTCLLGILYSLFVNHLLPIKTGDLVRIKIMSSRDDMDDETAAHSVIVLRLLDMICLIVFTVIGLLFLQVGFKVPVQLIIIGSVLFILSIVLAFCLFPAFLKRHIGLLKNALNGTNGMLILAATVSSWMLEAAVLYGTAYILHVNLSIPASIFANSVTVSGQIFQVTPGGIANYESFLVFALSLFGFAIKKGYAIAVITHAVKFFFSYAAGVIAVLIYPISLKTLIDWSWIKGVRGK